MKLQFLSKEDFTSVNGLPQDQIDSIILDHIELLVRQPSRWTSGTASENYMVFVKKMRDYEFIVDVYNDGQKYRLVHSILPEVGSTVIHTELGTLGKVIEVDYPHDEVTVDWEDDRQAPRTSLKYVRNRYS